MHVLHISLSLSLSIYLSLSLCIHIYIYTHTVSRYRLGCHTYTRPEAFSLRANINVTIIITIIIISIIINSIITIIIIISIIVVVIIIVINISERLSSPGVTPNPPTNIIPTNIARLKLSGKSPMDMRIPPLCIKIVPESNPLKSTMLAGRLGVAPRSTDENRSACAATASKATRLSR